MTKEKLLDLFAALNDLDDAYIIKVSSRQVQDEIEKIIDAAFDDEAHQDHDQQDDEAGTTPQQEIILKAVQKAVADTIHNLEEGGGELPLRYPLTLICSKVFGKPAAEVTQQEERVIEKAMDYLRDTSHGIECTYNDSYICSSMITATKETVNPSGNCKRIVYYNLFDYPLRSKEYKQRYLGIPRYNNNRAEV